MNEMLVQIPIKGTARKAQLTMTRAAGKTGTTQGYRDAWFVGFTGNFTAAVWYGNDSFRPTNKLTGGSLPVQTWHRFMEAAHQGIELKPIPFIDDPLPSPTAPKVAAGPAEGAAPQPVRPLSLNNAAQKLLLDLGKQFETAPPLGPEKVAANRPAAPASAAGDRPDQLGLTTTRSPRRVAVRVHPTASARSSTSGGGRRGRPTRCPRRPGSTPARTPHH